MTGQSFGCRRRAGGGPASGRTTRLATVNWLAAPTQPLPRLYECLQPPSRTDSTVRRAYVLVTFIKPLVVWHRNCACVESLWHTDL